MLHRRATGFLKFQLTNQAILLPGFKPGMCYFLLLNQGFSVLNYVLFSIYQDLNQRCVIFCQPELMYFGMFIHSLTVTMTVQ